MDNNNFTLTISLLPNFIMTSDREFNTDLPLRNAANYILIPLFLAILIGELLRRAVKRKISSNVTEIPEPSKFIHMDGTCDEDYIEIRQAFYQNFEKDWEKGGAALSVFHKGKLIVDLWGGFADKESRRLWRKDTLAVSFSSTKAVSALCVAILVDRNQLSYDDLVIKYWPEFGKHGKDKITVQMVLSHMSGLAYLDKPITYEDAKSNPDKISKAFEDQVPNWEGSQVGYHALTYGWLVDQIIRRADPQHRSLGEFYKQEIANKLDEEIDYHIGLPKSEAGRVSRITLPSLKQRISEFITNPWGVYYYRYFKDFMNNNLLARVERNQEWLRFVFEITLNNPEIYSIEQGALMGIGTARSLAKIFQDAIMNNKLFTNAGTLKQFLTPFINKPDIVTAATVSRGNGLMFSPFKMGEHEFKMIGHAGYGGQNIKFDVENELVFCYLSNGLKAGFGDSARTFVALRNAIYTSVIKQKNLK